MNNRCVVNYGTAGESREFWDEYRARVFVRKMLTLGIPASFARAKSDDAPMTDVESALAGALPWNRPRTGGTGCGCDEGRGPCDEHKPVTP